MSLGLVVAATFAVGFAQTAAVPTPGDTRMSVSPLVERVRGSVVTIQSTKVVRRYSRPDPFSQLFGMGQREQRQAQQGLGSGFILDKQGTIITNNHVVAGAEIVRVQLSDGRSLEAHIRGTDPDTDVAVVQIAKPPADLRPVTLGDSERVKVGDYVLAIGNPLGLGQTVTMGIVSAKNRTLKEQLNGYEDFIQTDAAINQGNSGGPLFNFAGEVIGVNSAIINPAMAMNVGFAIPINLARQVAQQIIKTGQVARGRLGTSTMDLTAEEAARLGVAGGAKINTVVPRSPAEAAGLRPNDIVVEIAGRPVDSSERLRIIVQTREPTETVPIVYLRNGKRVETKARLTENPDVSSIGAAVLGMRVKPLSPHERSEVGLETEALRVVSVDPRGPASGSVEKDDLIVGFNRKAGMTLDALKQLEKTPHRGRSVEIIFSRNGELFSLTLR